MAGFTDSAGDRVDARVWCKFDGTGTPGITDDYNVSTIGDLIVGGWQVNFSVAMSNADYCAISEDHSYGNGWCDQFATGKLRKISRNEGGANIDTGQIFVAVFGN